MIAWMNEWMNENECGKAWKVIGMNKYVRMSRFANFKRLRDQPTDRPTDRLTDMTSYRSARTHLKTQKTDKRTVTPWLSNIAVWQKHAAVKHAYVVTQNISISTHRCFSKMPILSSTSWATNPKADPSRRKKRESSLYAFMYSSIWRASSDRQISKASFTKPMSKGS